MPSTNALGALLGHQRSVVAGVKFAFITWGIRAAHGGRLVRGRAAFGAMNTPRDRWRRKDGGTRFAPPHAGTAWQRRSGMAHGQ
jgi:hypothetical protein